MYVQVIQTKERDVTLTQTLLQQNMMFKRAILLFLTQAVIQALTFSTVEDYTNPIVIVFVASVYTTVLLATLPAAKTDAKSGVALPLVNTSEVNVFNFEFINPKP